MDDKKFVAKLRDAIVKGDVNVTKRLIKGGVDVNAIFWYDGTLLHEAVITGKTEIVKLLLQAGIQVNTANKSGDTPLHLACRRKKVDIAKYLLEQKASVNAVTESGKTPLHIAIWQECESIVNLLLNYRASVRIYDQDWWSALHWVARSTSMCAVIPKILDRGAEINAKTKLGATPLHIGVIYKNVKAVEILIQNGADTSITPLNSAIHAFTCSSLRKSNDMGRNLLNILHKCGIKLRHDKDCEKDTRSDKCECNKLKNKLTKDSKQEKLESKLTKCQYCSNVKACDGVQSLGYYSRNAIRKHLNIVHGGRAIKKYTQELPLPQILRDYLIFTEELQSL